VEKKDYAAVAGVMARTGSYASDSGQRILIRNIVIALACRFTVDDPQFDHAVFYKACSVTDGQGNVILASDELIC
jgi:hypothetical protein